MHAEKIAKEIKDLNKIEGLSPGQELNTILAENGRLRAEHIVYGQAKILCKPAKSTRSSECSCDCSGGSSALLGCCFHVCQAVYEVTTGDHAWGAFAACAIIF